METIRTINYILSVIFLVCYSYQFVYIFISLFLKRKSLGTYEEKKYAVLICARNEENVIGQLISSIHNQDYSKNLIDIYVAADNCTDDTAKIARQLGAIVYERRNTEKVGKGYALN
ncbi:MAG: glycosyltransferase, partial [Clostridia bacterium]|nr:glycosyltransferase [Clostridia bacterium]